MSRKEDADPIAVAMVQKRWDKTTAKQRSELARKMNEARWGAGYVAKRPAAARKKAAAKKTAKKKA